MHSFKGFRAMRGPQGQIVLFIPWESPFVGQITREGVFGLQEVPPGGKHDVVDLVEIQKTPEIKSHTVVYTRLVGAVIEDFPSQRENRREVPLNFPSQKDPILVARARVEPIAPAPEGRPRPPAFLEPEGKQELILAASQALGGVARRDIDLRKKGSLGKIGALVDKPVLKSN